MRLTFLGHAAFLVESAGKRVIFDPYSSQIGYQPIHQSADFVALSHENPVWHSYLGDIEGDFETVRGLEILENPLTRGALQFGAARAWEKPGEGENAMVWLESEDLRLLHLGDCGVLPDDQTLQKCGRVDVLLALAGGFPTLDLDDLMILIEKLAPKIVIPMHFGVPGLQMKALGVEASEARFAGENIVRHEGAKLDVRSENLPAATQLHVLKPLRLKL